MSEPERPEKPSAFVKHVDVRLDPDVLARLDALIPTMSTEWRQARRSDVLRRVILSGLTVIEKQQATKTPRKQARAKKARSTR